MRAEMSMSSPLTHLSGRMASISSRCSFLLAKLLGLKGASDAPPLVISTMNSIQKEPSFPPRSLDLRCIVASCWVLELSYVPIRS